MTKQNKQLGKLVQEYIDANRLRFEGESGIQNLSQVAMALGYKGHGYMYGSPLEEFLSDNPGAQQAILNWIGEQKIPQWIESVEGELPEQEQEQEEDADEGI